MPLQHLQLFSIFEADDIIGGDGLLDRYSRLQFRRHFSRRLRLNSEFQRLVNSADQRRQIGWLHRIFGYEGGNDLAGQGDKFGVHGGISQQVVGGDIQSSTSCFNGYGMDSLR